MAGEDLFVPVGEEDCRLFKRLLLPGDGSCEGEGALFFPRRERDKSELLRLSVGKNAQDGSDVGDRITAPADNITRKQSVQK